MDRDTSGSVHVVSHRAGLRAVNPETGRLARPPSAVPDIGTSCGSRSLSIPDHSKARNGKPEGIEGIEGIWEKVANESAQKEIPGDGFDGCDAFAVGGSPT
jgi:hypothetical protein